jgi:hypothetical protein
MGAAWEWHGMCELALNMLCVINSVLFIVGAPNKERYRALE